jgi:hypothetical protein
MTARDVTDTISAVPTCEFAKPTPMSISAGQPSRLMDLGIFLLNGDDVNES